MFLSSAPRQASAPRHVVFLSCALFFLFQGGGAHAQTLGQAFEQMDRSAQSFKAMAADIARTIHTAAINDDSRDGGSIRLKVTKKNTRMLIQFTGTDAKSVALSGQMFQIYYPKTNTVQVWDLGKNRTLVDQFLLLGFGASSDEIKKAYDVTYAGEESISGQKTDHLVLTPKSADVLKRLKKAELWIQQSRGVPVQQKFFTSSDGDSTLVTYTNMKLNPPVSDSDLQLKTPKGVHTEYPQRN